MTGFGRSQISRDGREMILEMKSVNHRYLDLHFRLPKPLAFAEEPLRKWIRTSQIKRGHIELSAIYRNNRTDATSITLDRELVLQCAKMTTETAKTLDAKPLSVYELIKLCDALSLTELQEDTDEVLALLQEAFSQAQTSLQNMRKTEGAVLKADLQKHLQSVRETTKLIAELAPTVPQEYRERLLGRLQEWEIEISDPARVAQEVALIADKCAIDEELSRLQSHFKQFADCLEQNGEVGRRMDFLLQEMNREINTIGSKASHAQITKYVVDIKSVLEKLREQVQNVE